MAKKGIDRKALDGEISRALMSDTERFEANLARNWKLIVAALVGIAILVTVIGWASLHQKSRNRAAQEALSGAETAAELRAALETHGASPAAGLARYRLAHLYLADNDYESARQELARAASGTQDEFLKGNMLLDEAYVLELQGKYEEAADHFAALADRLKASEKNRAEAAYAAGRLYIKTRQWEEARAMLDRADLTRNSQASQVWSEMSSSLLRALQAGEFTPAAPAAPVHGPALAEPAAQPNAG